MLLLRRTPLVFPHTCQARGG